MLRDAAGLALRLDQLNDTLCAEGRTPLSGEQRHIIANAYKNAASLSAQQRLQLLRLLRTSDRWPRMRASVSRETAAS